MKVQLLFTIIKIFFSCLNEMIEEYGNNMYNNKANAKNF